VIHIQEIEGRKLASWINSGGLSPERRTLVFVHGSGGTHADWILQYASLKNAFNVVAIDLPGHGQSAGPGERAVPLYVVWVKKMLDGLGIASPVLIGHSLGAAICLSFVIRHPDAAAAVVPVGGGTRMPVNPAVLEGLLQDPASVIELIARFSVAKANRERLSGLITENLSRVDPSILHGDFTACDALDITETAGRIGIPLLALCGTEDKLMPPAFSEKLCKLIAGARLVLIEGSGHCAMLEDPSAFNGALTDFVNALPA